jgi:hypothetical protein
MTEFNDYDYLMRWKEEQPGKGCCLKLPGASEEEQRRGRYRAFGVVGWNKAEGQWEFYPTDGGSEQEKEVSLIGGDELIKDLIQKGWLVD